MENLNREKEIYRVTLVGSAVNVLLLAFKFVAGLVGHSAAMMADAVHSLSDFVTDLIVLVFVRISHKPQDEGHDYGHGKYETLATTIIGLALLAVAIGIIVSGAVKIAAWAGGQELAAPGMLALWAALVSIALKEGTYQYTIRRARKLKSQAVEANAWHHRSDALSSIGTAVGIGGAILLGQRWTVLDPIASVVVGAFIVKVSFDLLKCGIGELMERSLPESVEKEIMDLAASVDGVIEPHDLRTRRIGNRYAIELHIYMDGNMTLTQAHDKADEIETLLRQTYGEETHVAVHVEPFPVLIRSLCESDYEFVLKTNLDNVEVLSPMDKERLLLLKPMTELFLIAEVDGKPAAFLMAMKHGADAYDSENYRWFSSRYEQFLYIDRIVIAEPYRHLGIGSKLYEAVFEHARELNIPYVTCEVDTIPYNGPSLNFHREMGFHEVGTQHVNLNDVTVSLQEKKL